MNIKIAARFRPFSHLPGAACLIPGQEKVCRTWPARTELSDLDGVILSTEEGQKTLFQDLDRPFQSERISFGSHKSQDWDAIRKRGDLKEILPLWYKLGTFYPVKGDVLPGSLLYQLLHEEDRNKLPELFLQTYYAGFSSYFVPRRTDLDYHGYDQPPLNEEPLTELLAHGKEAIKRMLVDVENDTLLILPRLPSLFHHGRVVDMPVPGGLISIEWTKHFMRRMIYTPIDEQVEIRFPKEVKQYCVKAIGKSFHFDKFEA